VHAAIVRRERAKTQMARIRDFEVLCGGGWGVSDGGAVEVVGPIVGYLE
jgi:hypothetical protein